MNDHDLLLSEIRYGSEATLVFKGCELRCVWCERPELRVPAREILFDIDNCVECGKCSKACGVGMQKMRPVRIYDRGFCTRCGNCVPACPNKLLSVCGNYYTVDEVVSGLTSHGARSLTALGGDPACRHEPLIALFEAAKRAGIVTRLETPACFDASYAARIAAVTDEFVFDLFDSDPVRFRENTRGDVEKIFENVKTLDSLGKPSALRIRIIPGVNVGTGFVRDAAKLYGSLKNCERVEFVPYRKGGAKAAKLIDIYRYPEYREPTEAEIAGFKEEFYK